MQFSIRGAIHCNFLNKHKMLFLKFLRAIIFNFYDVNCFSQRHDRLHDTAVFHAHDNMDGPFGMSKL